MPELLKMDPASKLDLVNYPQESRYVRWGMTASIGAHVLFALIVLILAWWNNIHSLRDLMTSAIAMEPPPNEIQIILPPDDTPPPPTDHPLFIKQIIKQIKPPPIPKPKPKPPPPKPTPIIQHVHATTARAESQLVIGSSSFPQPTYPGAAIRAHLQGTVVVHLDFDSAGGVENCEVVKSCGSSLLDDYTRRFILANWRDPGFANRHVTQPVEYILPH
jgi:TonB family protein